MLITRNEIAVIILFWFVSSVIFFVMGRLWEANNHILKLFKHNRQKEQTFEKLYRLYRDALNAYFILEEGAWPYINSLYASVLEIGGRRNFEVFKEAFQKEITSSRFKKASSAADIEDFELYVDWA